MASSKLDNIIAKIETQAKLVKFRHEVADMFLKALQDNDEELDSIQKQELEWEYLLFRLSPKTKFTNDGKKIKRFSPMAHYEDGSIFPDPISLSEKAIAYFEKRANTTQSPVFKSKYLDFLWEYSSSRQKYLFGKEAITEYLKAFFEYENEESIFLRLDCLQRAGELTKTFEVKAEEKPLTNAVVKVLKQQVHDYGENKKFRWLIELFELIVDINYGFSNKEIGQLLNLCDEAIKHYAKDQNYHIQRHFIQLKAQLAAFVTDSSSAKKQMEVDIAVSYEEEAASKTHSGMVRVHFLQEAIKQYDKIGDKKKVSDLIEEVKKSTKQAIDHGEFKQISSTVEIKKEDIEKMKASLGIGDQIPQNMGNPALFMPSWEHAKKMTEEHKKKFVFMHIVKKSTYGKEYPINNPSSAEAEEEDNILFNYEIIVKLNLQWLTSILYELQTEKKFSSANFVNLLSKLKEIDENTYNTVMLGIEYYFANKHFEAICILTPQLEDLLRKLLSLFGEQTTIQHIQANAFTEKNLNGILRDIRPYIKEDLYHYISWILDDYRGGNLRYKMGHGFLKSNQASPLYTVAVIHIFCLLIANTIISSERPNATK